MNKGLIFALILLSASFASYTYSVDVDRSGFASVTVSLEGGDAVNVSLPQDASSFRIVGGSYKLSGANASVSAGPSGLAVFSFSSAALTAKTDTGWKLSFSPPEGASIRIYAPPYASIESSFPQPDSISSEGSRLVVEVPYSKQITVYYSLAEPPESVQNPDFLVYAILVLALAILAAAAFMRGRNAPQPVPPAPAGQSSSRIPAERPAAQGNLPGLGMTAGKKGMMETFNENDLAIVNYLLGCGGKSRRNELERKTGISKSSLAMALNRLEKRKIIELDRTSTTHFVKLSDYFLRL